MKADDYINSPEISERLKSLVKDKDLKSEKEMSGSVMSVSIDSFNAGFVEGMNVVGLKKEESDLRKSKELTKLTPSKFSETNTCKTLIDLILGSIETNSTDNTLNVGYDQFVTDTAIKAFQVAYAAGLTAGFEIASDPITSTIYKKNSDRIIKQGIGGNK